MEFGSVPTLPQLRRYALARSLNGASTLPQALQRLAFVQADPIRSPARAQDLILRHRVRDYRVGDLDRRYPHLAVEEDFYINYGYIRRDLHALMHPRSGYRPWPQSQWAQAHAVVQAVRTLGVAHPDGVDQALSLGHGRNFFGGRSRTSTQLLDGLHYRGLLRVARREGGTRLYAVRPSPPAEPAIEGADTPDGTHAPGATASTVEQALADFDTLVDAIVALYAPVPETTLRMLVGRCCYAVPQLKHLRPQAVQRALRRLERATVEGVRWYWPVGERPQDFRFGGAPRVRLLAPFDPVVWDRLRFEHFWGWAYRFEAYTPAPQRVRGYYAMPMLWGEAVVGWANCQWRSGRLEASLGYVAGSPPSDARFAPALEAELTAFTAFMGR